MRFAETMNTIWEDITAVERRMIKAPAHSIGAAAAKLRVALFYGRQEAEGGTLDMNWSLVEAALTELELLAEPELDLSLSAMRDSDHGDAPRPIPPQLAIDQPGD